MNKADLLAILDDIRAGIEANDSFEGNVQYLMPEEDGYDFMVSAAYRVGNSMGQGGMRMIGDMGLEGNANA